MYNAGWAWQSRIAAVHPPNVKRGAWVHGLNDSCLMFLVLDSGQVFRIIRTIDIFVGKGSTKHKDKGYWIQGCLGPRMPYVDGNERYSILAGWD